MSGREARLQTIVVVAIVSALIVGIAVGFMTAPLVVPAQTVTVTVKERIGPKGEVPIGALLPLSGALSSVAENSKVALEIAEKEVNEYLAEMGAPWRIKVYVEDTELKPSVALEKLQTLHAKGIRVVIGPMASASVHHIKEYADSNNILVITQSSTAVNLAIPGDNILRLSPSDVYQAKVGPKYAKMKDITHVILMWRGDTWGDGLAEEAKKNYEKLGIKVVGEIRYVPEATEFSAEVSTLASRVDNLLSQGVPPEKIMIHLISFEEAEMIFLTASQYPNLAKVIWFGSDGTALNPKLIRDRQAAEFAVKTDFVSPVQAPIETTLSAEFASKFEEILGRGPDSYSYNSYDILWLIALTILQTGSDDPQVLKEAIPEVAARMWGVSGPIKLDENGDRVPEYYTLTKIVEADGGYEWAIIGKYILKSDEIILE